MEEEMENEKKGKAANTLTRKQFSILVLIIVAFSLIPSRVSITLTPSLDKRVFLLSRSPDPRSIKKGDYILFSIADKFPGTNRPKTEKAIKKISCVEGETISIREKEYFCNDEFLVKAKDISLKGEPLKNFAYEGPVPPGSYFVTAAHKDSFDSRYFGFLKQEEITAKAHPIF